MDKEGFILSVSIAGYEQILEKAYNLPDVGKYADLVNVMTYDYHGSWEDKTGHHSPLRQVTQTENPAYNSARPKSLTSNNCLGFNVLVLQIGVHHEIDQQWRCSQIETASWHSSLWPKLPFKLQSNGLWSSERRKRISWKIHRPKRNDGILRSLS